MIYAVLYAGPPKLAIANIVCLKSAGGRCALCYTGIIIKDGKFRR